MSANNLALFESAVKSVFDNWTAYKLVLVHNFGGSETKQKAEWFENATYQWIVDNEGLEDYELEEFFIDTMNTEFDTVLEDNSAMQVAQTLINYYNLYKNGDYLRLESEINRLKSNKSSSSIQQSTAQGETSSDDDGDSDEEEEDNEMTTDDNNNADKSSKAKPDYSEEMESVEDGWTYVAKGGKHITK